jgi:hypothetical protein
MSGVAARNRRRRGGNMVLEALIFMHVMLLLVVGMLRIAEITYLYATLKKTLYAAGTFLSAQQGVDFCSDSTGLIQAAKNYALTGTTEGSLDSFLPALTADMIDISPECFDPATQTVGTCDTSACGSAEALLQPDYIVVSIPSGYAVNPKLPFILSDSIPLRPFVRIPFGGT